jgi:hypothetical protein
MSNQRKTSEITLTPAHISRFWQKVDKSGGCWIWTGCKTPLGYGQACCAGGHRKAHRVSFTISNGPIPDGLDVLHKCDNPSCVNPSHLEAGTHLQNMEQMKIRGRAAVGNKHGMRIHPERVKRGTAHHMHGKRGRNLKPTPGSLHKNAKLTEEMVLQMRIEREQGFSQVALAHKYQVSQASVWMIIHRRAWKHVPPGENPNALPRSRKEARKPAPMVCGKAAAG